MERITIPAVYCPFPSVINPCAEAVHEQSLTKLQRLGLIQKETARRRFLAARFAWLTARCYPATAFEELTWVHDWSIWLFMFDDQFDDGAIGGQPERMQPIMAKLLAILEDPDASSPRSPLGAALYDFWQRAPGATSAWRARFAQHLADYFTSYLWEARNRARGHIPAVDAYIANRQQSGGLPTCFDLIDLSDHVTLPPEVYESQEFRTLRQTATNVVCWVNDVFSLRKERARGDVNNLVLAVQHAHHMSLQAAVNTVNDMITKEVQRFIETERQLPGYPSAIEQNMRRYLLVFRAWMRGNLDWSYETPRYAQVEETAPGEKVSYLESLH